MSSENLSFKTPEEARSYAKKLGFFYKHFSLYGILNATIVFIWIMSGEGFFWPILVMLGWGFPLLLSAVELKLVPPSIDEPLHAFINALPFLRPEWEDEQVAKLLGTKKATSKEKTSALTVKSPAKSKSAPKKMVSVAQKPQTEVKPISPKAKAKVDARKPAAKSKTKP